MDFTEKKKVVGTPPKPTFTTLRSLVDRSAVEIFPEVELSPDQEEIYDKVSLWSASRNAQTEHPLVTLGGYAGSGKTTLVSQLARRWEKEGRRIGFIAPTGKAAGVLRKKMRALGLSSSVGTVHSLLYTPKLTPDERLAGWRRKKPEEVAQDYDMLIVDEASMLDSSLEEDLKAVERPILAVGDHGQLPPVHGVSKWMRAPMLRLEKIHRQAADNPLIRLAHWVRENGRMPSRENLRSEYQVDTKNLRTPEFSEHLQHTYDRVGFDETVLLTYTNRLRADLNKSVHRHYQGGDELKHGSRVICLKNLYEGQLINGMRGVVRGNPEKKWPWLVGEVEIPDDNILFTGAMLEAQFGRSPTVDGCEDAAELLEALVPRIGSLGALFDYGYVLTVHKAQGSEYQEVFLVLEPSYPPQFGKWLYTAITRASTRLTIAETWS